VSSAKAEKANDQLFCREQLAKTGSMFRVSRVFAPPALADKLLALYALFSAVEQICAGHADEEVARNRLNWWRLECLEKDLAASQHPIVRELVRTRAGDTMKGEDIEKLLNAAESRLGIDDNEWEWSQGRVASGGMVQLARESTLRNAGQGYWWVPLDLMARHGVSRADMIENPSSDSVIHLFAEVTGSGYQWACGTQPSTGRPAGHASMRHFVAVSGMQEHVLRRLKRLKPNRYAGELGQPGMRQLIAGWKAARRVRRYRD
jgi:phytoene/squalene synthetase